MSLPYQAKRRKFKKGEMQSQGRDTALLQVVSDCIQASGRLCKILPTERLKQDRLYGLQLA
jgi:hypothetical protein